MRLAAPSDGRDAPVRQKRVQFEAGREPRAFQGASRPRGDKFRLPSSNPSHTLRLADASVPAVGAVAVLNQSQTQLGECRFLRITDGRVMSALASISSAELARRLIAPSRRFTRKPLGGNSDRCSACARYLPAGSHQSTSARQSDFPGIARPDLLRLIGPHQRKSQSRNRITIRVRRGSLAAAL